MDTKRPQYPGQSPPPPEPPAGPPKPPTNSIPIEDNSPHQNENVIEVEHYENVDSIGSLMKKGAMAFFEYIIEFEEDHPWIFFMGIALILFLIIGAISSMLFNFSTDTVNVFNIFNKTDQIEEEILEEKVQVSESFSAIQGIDIGFQISKQEAFDNIVYKTSNNSLLTEEIIYIQEVDKLLARNIQEELERIPAENARYEHLKKYLEDLISIEKKGATLYAKLQATIKNLTNEEKHFEQEYLARYDHLNSIMWTAKKNEISNALTLTKEANSKYNDIKSTRKLAEPVLEAFQKPLKLAQARIAGIRANKDVLLSGLKFVSIDQTGLNFQENGEIEKWYKSELDLSKNNADLTDYINQISANQNANYDPSFFDNSQLDKKKLYNTVIPGQDSQNQLRQPNQFVSPETLNSVMPIYNIRPEDVPTL
jgi:flagellar motility protein MotE (MotC chaperone)